MNATNIFLPNAISPRSVAGPSAITSPFSIWSPLFIIGAWFIQVPAFERLNLSNLYLSFTPSSLFIIISSAVTLSAIPEFLATTTAPESLAALYSTPVPITGASLLTRGTAWRCMFAPIRARLASSFSKKGIIAVAIETTCFGDISM